VCGVTVANIEYFIWSFFGWYILMQSLVLLAHFRDENNGANDVPKVRKNIREQPV
jgi:hypothetical protein